MSKTKQLKIFDDEYFPVGSCVQITQNSGLCSKIVNGLIQRYESMGTVMIVYFIDIVAGQYSYMKLHVKNLDTDYSLIRLVPEKVVEESNGD